MGSLGIDRGRHTALTQIGQDSVGITDGDAEPLGQLLSGDVVGADAFHIGHQFLQRQGGELAPLGEIADVGHCIGIDHQPIFGIQRADQISVVIQYEAFFADSGFPDGNLDVGHGMRDSCTHTVADNHREIQLLLQIIGKPADSEIPGQEADNLQGCNNDHGVIGFLLHAVDQIIPDEIANLLLQERHLGIGNITGMNGQNLNNGGKVVLQLLQLQPGQYIVDQTF